MLSAIEAAKVLKSRWKPEYAKYGLATTVHKHFVGALAAAERLEAKHAALKSDRDLSDQGRAKKLRDAAVAEAAPIAKAGRALKAARDKLHAQKLALTPTVANKGDVAAAFLRQEIRAALSKNTDQIYACVKDPNVDSLTLESLFEGPAYLCSISEDQRANLLQTVLERHAGPALKTIEQIEEALNLVGSAISTGHSVLVEAAGVPAHQLAKFLDENAPASSKEIEESQDTYRADVLSKEAQGLPFQQRANIIDKLLAANVAEIRS